MHVEKRSHEIISSESKLCSDCSTSTSNEVQINPPCNPDDTLGNIKFCDFITWMKEDFETTVSEVVNSEFKLLKAGSHLVVNSSELS